MDYQRIEKSIGYLIDNFHDQPDLKQIAAKIHMSEYHFQRLFSRWVGISPKRFLQFLTKEHAKKLLEKSVNLLDVTYEAGLTSPGRLHDLFVSCEAVTPGEYKARGRGLSYPLDSFAVTLHPGEPARLLSIAGGKCDASGWWLKSLQPESGYVGAVVVQDRELELTCWGLMQLDTV